MATDWWEGRPRPDSDRDQEVAPTEVWQFPSRSGGRPPSGASAMVGGSAVLGAILSREPCDTTLDLPDPPSPRPRRPRPGPSGRLRRPPPRLRRPAVALERGLQPHCRARPGRDGASPPARQPRDPPLGPGPRLLDVGTGPGLPGIPLALADPGLQVTLLDANGKKVRFCRQAVNELGLGSVEVVQARVEAYRPDTEFATITARAVADLPSLVASVRHLLAGTRRSWR